MLRLTPNEVEGGGNRHQWPMLPAIPHQFLAFLGAQNLAWALGRRLREVASTGSGKFLQIFVLVLT
jgi:hypothetical protein